MTDDREPKRWWLRRLVNRLEMDRATFYVVSTRGWRLLAGPLTMLLIAWHFTRDAQGYYFTFWNVLSLQALVDLGISGVIIQCASHEWAELRLQQGEVAGKEDRRQHLSVLASYFNRWFFRASLVFAALVAPLGVWFFDDGSASSQTVNWFGPWLTLTALTAVSLTMIPRIAVLEGCGQVAAVNRMRLLQMICGNVGVWTAICLGLELWVAVVAAGIQIGGELLLLLSFRRFFASMPAPAADAQPRDWDELVRPMQWRVALRSGVKFFASNLITPVMMRYHGAAVAGRMGMTWNLLSSLQQAAFAWIGTRAPLFGEYVAKRRFDRLDEVFLRLTTIAVTVMSLGCGAVWLGVLAVNAVPGRITELLADRLLDPTTTAVLAAALTLSLAISCIGRYLHAHRRAPQVPLLAGIDVAAALLVWRLGARFGPLAAATVLAAFAALQLALMTCFWRHYRRQWHAEEAPDAGATRQ